MKTKGRLRKPPQNTYTFHVFSQPKYTIPRGIHTFGSPPRNKLSTGVPTAAARCAIPESFPTNTRAPRSQHPSSHKSAIRTAPANSSSGPQTHRTGITAPNRPANASNRPIETCFLTPLANGCTAANVRPASGTSNRGNRPTRTAPKPKACAR